MLWGARTRGEGVEGVVEMMRVYGLAVQRHAAGGRDGQTRASRPSAAGVNASVSSTSQTPNSISIHEPLTMKCSNYALKT